MTCDIVLGTAPTDADCTKRLDGTAAVPETPANAATGAAAIPAVAAIAPEIDLTGQAGRRRRSFIRREASSEYQESTGKKSFKLS